MSISSKIQSLITAANSVTGESRTDLTAAVQDLKDGYGQGGGGTDGVAYSLNLVFYPTITITYNGGEI